MMLRSRMKKRLRSVQGDTLVEAMVALLIAALGAAALATMVMASVSVSTQSQRSLDAVYQAESNMVLVPSAISGPSVTVSIPGQGGLLGMSGTVACKLYQGTQDGTAVFMRYEEDVQASTQGTA